MNEPHLTRHINLLIVRTCYSETESPPELSLYKLEATAAKDSAASGSHVDQEIGKGRFVAVFQATEVGLKQDISQI